MELNSLDFEARKRNAWQVFDLTLLAVHRWGFKMFILWFLQASIIFLPLMLLFDNFVALLVVWWFKPVIERPLLHYASQVAFGYRPTTRECLGAIKDLGFGKILLLLTWRRFSLQRAYVAPVDQLEGLKGSARTGRLSVLDSLSNHRQSLWLIFCLHVEMICMFAFSLALYSMMPGTQEIEFDVQLLFLYEDTFSLVSTLTSLLSYGLIAPYYVTGGFLGYINSRAELEGWDIELAFKRMSKRIMPALCLLLCLPLIGGLYGNTAEAVSMTFDDVETVRMHVENIYSEEEVVVISNTWQMAEQEFGDYNFDVEWLIAFIEWLVDVFTGDYAWVAAFFWGIIIVLLGFVVWKLVRLPKVKLRPSVKPHKLEMPQFVKTVITRDIPSDLLAAATAANKKGDSRLALAWLLYHGFSFAHKHYGVSLKPSMTEGECESSLQAALSQQAFTPYSTLIQLWMSEAWAQKNASKKSIDELITVFFELSQESRAAVYL